MEWSYFKQFDFNVLSLESSKEGKSMFEPFDSTRSRYASGGIVQSMPEALIDSLWLIIDFDLKGVIPLDNLLTFHVEDNAGRVRIYFSPDNQELAMGIDLSIDYNPSFPQTIYVYDDGQHQTILLPNEAN
jgi:hypothetical protein